MLGTTLGSLTFTNALPFQYRTVQDAGSCSPPPVVGEIHRASADAARLLACARSWPQAGGAAPKAVPGSRTQILIATARQPAVAFVVRTAWLRAW